MKGVLTTQQRRFSRIVSTKNNKKLKLNMSNSDLQDVYQKNQQGSRHSKPYTSNILSNVDLYATN